MIYTEKPKRGNAKKAWDYFMKENDNKKPNKMYYLGRNWVAEYGVGRKTIIIEISSTLLSFEEAEIS